MKIATPSVMPSISGGWWYNWIKIQFRIKLKGGKSCNLKESILRLGGIVDSVIELRY
ncbi:MAG: hypothetical protein KAW00_02870 [Dehalococcoidia bacterium]|nr:hypothetical protein [Dehalococcoidia bacterium]